MVTLSDKLKNFAPYEASHNDYPIMLNANESFVPLAVLGAERIQSAVQNAAINRYPDPRASELCQSFARLYDVDADLVTAGNGLDEVINLLYGCLLDHGDTVLTLKWDFSMYSFYGNLYGCRSVQVPQREDLTIDVDAVIAAAKQVKPRMFIFSNPCNPTSIGLARADVLKLIENIDALVVVDEAYMDFYDQSVLDLAGRYDNLIVLKTCSKALAMAGLRIGFAVTTPEITRLLQTGKSPYNVNCISQAIGTAVMNQPEMIASAIGEIKASKRMLARGLERLAGEFPQIRRIMPSDTNFIFMEVEDCEKVYEGLKDEGILVRKMPPFLRITAGTLMENDSVLEALRTIWTEGGE